MIKWLQMLCRQEYDPVEPKFERCMTFKIHGLVRSIKASLLVWLVIAKYTAVIAGAWLLQSLQGHFKLPSPFASSVVSASRSLLPSCVALTGNRSVQQALNCFETFVHSCICSTIWYLPIRLAMRTRTDMARSWRDRQAPIFLDFPWVVITYQCVHDL